MATPGSFAADATQSNEQRVRDYVSAFHERKIDTITGETQGKPKLRERNEEGSDA